MAEIFTFFGRRGVGGGVREGAEINAVAFHQSGAGQIPVLLPYVRWVCWTTLLRGVFYTGTPGLPSLPRPTFDLIWLHLFQFDRHSIVYLTRHIICARSFLTRVNKFIINYYYDTFFRHGNRWYIFCRQLYQKLEPNYIELVSFQLLLDCQPRSLRYFHTVGWFTMTTGTSICSLQMAKYCQIRIESRPFRALRHHLTYFPSCC